MKKALLRREYLAKRQAMTSDEVGRNNNLIVGKAVDLLSGKSFEVVHIFLPLLTKNEIDTWKLIAALNSSPAPPTIAIPFVVPGTVEMQSYAFNPDMNLIENRWGIPEPDPTTGSQIASENIDVVILPLLSFDKQGFRVGYGGGFYDRFLQKCRPDVLKIGLSFFDPIERIADLDGFDIRMDYCLTPRDVWKW